VNPTRTNIVHRAVALIGPNEHRRAECVNAVHVTLAMITGYAKDLQRFSERRGKPGKRATDRLDKALQDLQNAIQDPNLSDELRQFVSPDDLARAIKRVNEERKKTGASSASITRRRKDWSPPSRRTPCCGSSTREFQPRKAARFASWLRCYAASFLPNSGGHAEGLRRAQSLLRC